jgi:hypothetical protein
MYLFNFGSSKEILHQRNSKPMHQLIKTREKKAFKFK